MRRLYLLVVTSVVGAVILASALNFMLIRSAMKPDLAGQPALLRPSVAASVRGLVELLEGDPRRTPATLSRRLGLAVAAGHAEEPAPGALTTTLRTGEELTIRRAAAGGLIATLHGPHLAAPLQLGPFPDDWPGEAERLSLALAVIVLVALLMSLLVTVPVARGLGRLTSAAQRLSAGDLDARAGHHRGVTGTVTSAFDAMADRVQTLLDNQRQLLQAVSHELRTPTARIRFSLELLEGAADDDARAKRVAAIDEDLSEIDDLVGELLTFTRINAAVDRRDDAAVPVHALLAQLEGYVSERAPHLTLSLGAGDERAHGAAVAVDQRLFTRAMRNLLLNAVRYAERDIEIRWTLAEGRVLIAVSDDGPGVAEDDRERILEPFQRGDMSRSRDSGGVGLGLAIVRRIVEVHGGEILVESSAAGGARFVTTWPQAV